MEQERKEGFEAIESVLSGPLQLIGLSLLVKKIRL